MEPDKRATDSISIRSAQGLVLRTVRTSRIEQFDNRPAPQNSHAAVLLADTQQGSLTWPAVPPSGPVYCQVTGAQTREVYLPAATSQKLALLNVEPAARLGVLLMH